MILTFEKETNGCWYIALPEWKGLHSQLQMVAGADDLLDLISKDAALVNLEVSLIPVPGYDKAEKLKKSLYGADYYLESYMGKKIYHKFWLCPVTTFVFGGEYPDELYIKEV